MSGKLYLNAMNVHQGGGRNLLESLVLSVKGETILLADMRMQLPIGIVKDLQVIRVRPSVLHRLWAEKWLADVSTKEDTILCFGNLPPIFAVRAHTVVFLQNRYLIENTSLSSFPLKVRIRLHVERLWLYFKRNAISEFVVQTPAMKKLCEQRMCGSIPIRVLPFVNDPVGYSRSLLNWNVPKDTVYDFVYIASGEPHKNHLVLLDAWCLLARDGLYPSLCLTLDINLFSDLCNIINERKLHFDLRVFNLGLISHDQVLELYSNSNAMIYPSTFESFGLPLVEARQVSLPVLASELDYVRDVLDPEQTFDPTSPLSIARAVKRFLGSFEPPLKLLDASQFLHSVLNKGLQ